MPRHPDPHLEERILKVAHHLWSKDGGKGLTLRAVALAAGTTTPTVYKRFRNRDELVRALLRRVQVELFELLQSCKDLEEAGEAYLDFAFSRPHEYQLFFSEWARTPAVRQPQVNVEFVKQRLADLLGGVPDDHTGKVWVLASLLHGMASLWISGQFSDELLPELRSRIKPTIRALLEEWKSQPDRGTRASETQFHIGLG